MLGVSMPKSLKARIKAAAAKENRTMANWCVWHLENLLNELESSKDAEVQSLKVAEDATPYRIPKRQ